MLDIVIIVIIPWWPDAVSFGTSERFMTVFINDGMLMAEEMGIDDRSSSLPSLVIIGVAVLSPKESEWTECISSD